MSLKAAKEALLRKRYTEAIAILLEYCQDSPDRGTKEYIQAQMWLVSSYQRTGRADKAIAICEQLQESPDPQLQQWSRKSLVTLRAVLAAEPDTGIKSNPDVASVIKSKPNRYYRDNVTLALAPRMNLYYILAAIATVSIVVGIIFGIQLWLISLVSLALTTGWAIVAITNTVVLSTLLFFMSPWIIETAQKQYHRTQWVTLADLDEIAPEAVAVIEKFCEIQNIDIPRLGLIEDRNPVAFIYGILPNSTRIVVSRGLLQLLDDDEIAAIYAYQLGRIPNLSVAIITFAAAPAQLIYLFHVWLSRLSFRAKRAKNALQLIALSANWLYNLGNYIVLWTTRTSTYLCDRTAAELTGNPNAMTRALTKIARGFVQQTQLGQPSRLLESTRALGTCDYKTAIPIGMAFEILYAGQSEHNLYKVFLWELFNPWANWLEWHSTHALIGRRVKQLTNYVKQLGLTSEYDFPQILSEGGSLNRAKLYRTFRRDLLIQTAPYTGLLLGLGLSFALFWLYNNWLPLSLSTIGLGLGIMFQGSLRYPSYRKVADTDLVSLLIDPYASTLCGQPVQIPGELLGYGRHEMQLGYTFKLEDQSGSIYLNYLPNLKKLYTDPGQIIQQMEILVGESVLATGWFRRGEISAIDLSTLKPILEDPKSKTKTLISYHQLWNNVLSSAIVLLGLTILAISSLFQEFWRW
jgi:Zn-dependent protease with chaperone function